jgi:hypothetical protein
LGLNLPESEGYTTIAGFLMTSAGRVLSLGDRVEHTTGIFTVERVDNRSIRRVRFLKTTPAGSPAGALSTITVLAAPVWSAAGMLKSHLEQVI